jgi:glycosyltransferase involved in cell wall biosynthesis
MRENPKDEYSVFVISKHCRKYNYEGINVFEGKPENLIAILKATPIDRIVVHFLMREMVSPLLKYAQDIPKIIWVHLFEAISWKRRIFNANSIRFLGYMAKNILQLPAFSKFAKNATNAKYVFVSKWLKDIVEIDLSTHFNNYSLIPNGIDEEVFTFSEKNENLRHNVLMIRSFNSRKYGTDLATQAIFELSKYKHFSKLNFTIVGEGKYFERDVSKLKKFSNVYLVNRFLNAQEIKNFHNKNGIFLCPTRQDSQGVSMCEAMSSGLVPITSNNSAIPEFVEDKVSGILTSGVDDIVRAIIKLHDSPSEFLRISKNASESVQKKCGLSKVVHEELNVILR